MALTDTAIRNAKPADKPIKLFDGGGLFLHITPAGKRYWRLKYRFAGKEKLLALGVYPDVGLKEARDKREEAKRLLGEGVDPSVERKIQKVSTVERAANSFEAVAREWHGGQRQLCVRAAGADVVRAVPMGGVQQVERTHGAACGEIKIRLFGNGVIRAWLRGEYKGSADRAIGTLSQLADALDDKQEEPASRKGVVLPFRRGLSSQLPA